MKCDTTKRKYTRHELTLREDKSVLKVRTQNFNTFSYRLVSSNNYFLHQEIQRLDETKLSQESMVPDHLFSRPY